MADNLKLRNSVDIKQTQFQLQPPRSSFALSDCGTQDQKVPFFFFFKSSFSRHRDPWVISLFILIHLGVFTVTMVVNNCAENSHGDCAFGVLGRMAFQPLHENPLLGPSSSTLDAMGALHRASLSKHQIWRLFTFPCLHSGAFHLLINLASVVYVGIHLEQEFGPLRTGIIYVLSAFMGSLFAAIFVQDNPEVGSSGAFLGLLGALLSVLIRNWKFYTNKISALGLIFSILAINLALGLLPFIDNFANIGGFVSGILLGFAVLYTPQTPQVAQNKIGLFDYDVKNSIELKQILDKPVLRIVSLLIFVLVFSGCLSAVLESLDINQYCSWCKHVDCVPSRIWSCNDATTSCEASVSKTQMTITCLENGNFRVFPFTSISQARKADLCRLICS